MEWIGGVLTDLIVGVIATFCAILLVYALARPRLQFDKDIQVTRRAKGDRYGVQVRNSGLVPILSMRAEAFLILDAGRAASVPIPLSRDTWTNVSRAELWRASPWLLIDEVNWRRHLPHLDHHYDGPLEEMMRDLGAKLYFRVTASSAIFSVAVVKAHAYTAADWELTPDSELPLDAS